MIKSTTAIKHSILQRSMVYSKTLSVSHSSITQQHMCVKAVQLGQLSPVLQAKNQHPPSRSIIKT